MTPEPTGDPTAADALHWAMRAADPEFSDWEGFTDWLEADPARAAHYDAAVAMLAAVERLVPPATPATVVDAPRRSWLRSRWTGGAIAAALIGAVGLGLWSDRAQPYAIETAAAEQHTVTLPDGSQIVLAGGSRVELDRNAPRFASVARGEMLFRVRHDGAHPFRVRAGSLEMTDLGTVFDVRRNAKTTRVAVAQGAVMIDPAGAALRLDPGQAVVATGDRLQRQQVAPDEVGGWRDGLLAFDGATLTEVAEDLSRHLATPVAVAPALANRPFRGTIDLRRAGTDPALLGALLDVRVRHVGTGWVLEPR